jgi:teichoic acid transport system ATP-binding protein
VAEESVPTVIVDDAHVVYRVHGSAAPGSGSPVASFKRLVTRTKAASVREVHAVKGVSFVAYRGEAIGLIGSNGSGKSTLLRAIAGLLPCDRGHIYAAGQPSLLGVNAALMNDLPGERNVVLGCLAMGMTPAEVKAAAPGIIEFSGINERGDFSTMPMRTYSSGMAARLRFSIAAAKKHDVLLIDEALATGDAKFRRRSEQRVRDGVPGQPHEPVDPRHLRTEHLAGVGPDPRRRPDRRRAEAVRGLHGQVGARHRMDR